MQELPVAAESEAIDLSVILLGRVLHIEEAEQSGPEIMAEIQRIVGVAGQKLAQTASSQKELRESLLDILRYLPARSGAEIAFVHQLAESASEPEIRQALVQAFKFASPAKDDSAARAALQAAAASRYTEIATAAREALARVKEEEA